MVVVAMVGVAVTMTVIVRNGRLVRVRCQVLVDT
jgi:hypothetical protein